MARSNWTTLKTIKTDNACTFYYVEYASQYDVICGSRSQIYWAILTDSSEITDFETNYKSTATQVYDFQHAVSKIYLEQSTTEEIVTAISNIGLSVALARFRPKFAGSESSILVGDSDTQILSINLDGKLDAFSINFDRKDVELSIFVDGTEIFRKNLGKLSDSAYHNLDSGAMGEMFGVKTANSGKQIILKWTDPVDIISNITIKAKSTAALTTNCVSYLIAYRTKVI